MPKEDGVLEIQVDDELEEDLDKDKDKDTDKDEDKDDLEDIEFENDDELEEEDLEKDKKEKEKEKDEDIDFKKQFEKQEKQIKNLNIALHAERQEKKKAKDEAGEVALTETQLQELFKEHKDDPDTLYSLVNYMVKQGSKTAKDDAVDAAEISQRKKAMDSGLMEHFPDLAEDDSELRINTNGTIKSMHLQDHPFKDFLAISAMIHKDLPEIRKTEYERGKKEAIDAKADVTRKKKAKETNLSPSGGGGLTNKAGKMNANMEDVAKRLGLSKRGRSVYQKLVKQGSTEE